MMSSSSDSPDAFSPPLLHSPDPEQQQDSASGPVSSLMDHENGCLSPSEASAGPIKVSKRSQTRGTKPQSILKKKGSFDSRTHGSKSPQQSILKRNSVGAEIALSVGLQSSSSSSSNSSCQVHPILKKSSSEDRTWWREEPRTDPSSSPSSSATATPRPILKKKASVDDVVRGSNEIRPILKRKDSPKSDPEFIPKPIIKSLSRNSSDESALSPTGHTSRVMIQSPVKSEEIESDLPFTGPFVARVMQPRRRSHPVSAEDLRILPHPLPSGKRSPPPFCHPHDRKPQQTQHSIHRQEQLQPEEEEQQPLVPNQQSFQHPQHNGSPVRRSPPLLKSLPTSPSSGFERLHGVTYAFVDEFDKKLCLAAELNASPINRTNGPMLHHPFGPRSVPDNHN